jgi:hypothetical protein
LEDRRILARERAECTVGSAVRRESTRREGWEGVSREIQPRKEQAASAAEERLEEEAEGQRRAGSPGTIRVDGEADGVSGLGSGLLGPSGRMFQSSL